MAHSFLFLTLVREANDLDDLLSRRQEANVRNTILNIREDDYVRLFRLTKKLVDDVDEDLEGKLKTTKTLNSKTKILCTLSFLASGSYQRIISANIFTFVSQPTMSRSIHDVVDALSHPDIVRKYLRFPQTSQESQLLKERFYQKFKINGCIGCVDGTFIAMIRPTKDEERYYCRKGYHAINVQLIVDADLNILHVDATLGGSFHDSFIFNNSVIKEHLEEVNNSNETAYLLGDSAHCQRAYMMVPVPNVLNGSPEATYNKVHATAVLKELLVY
ncbi:unnamed protein product [Pieris macdunnoughi]|uniref:DDE Tnp4 domain-containing protein n=1 Tax=Pieris macdunnoughi TaxID=345717 RepID=A0A821XR16_9NEOP|nr:unnamed protein product [Pieris macdunnoughi]